MKKENMIELKEQNHQEEEQIIATTRCNKVTLYLGIIIAVIQIIVFFTVLAILLTWDWKTTLGVRIIDEQMQTLNAHLVTAQQKMDSLLKIAALAGYKV
jgi:hypothetical protein